MLPVIQTIHTSTDGNCIAASLASILENNIDDYPQLPNNNEWYPTLNRYLHSIGWNLVLIEQPHPSCLAGYHLIIGLGNSGGRYHCVVAREGIVVHDPSPYRTPESQPLEDPYYGIIQKIIL